jgi:hypothetical protein
MILLLLAIKSIRPSLDVLSDGLEVTLPHRQTELITVGLTSGYDFFGGGYRTRGIERRFSQSGILRLSCHTQNRIGTGRKLGGVLAEAFEVAVVLFQELV